MQICALNRYLRASTEGMDAASSSSQHDASPKPKSSGLFRNRPSWAKTKPSLTTTVESKVERDMFSKSDLTFARMKEESARRAEAERAEREKSAQEEMRLKERQAKRRKVSDEGLAAEKIDSIREESKSPKR